jgi:hypothetical protein
MDELSSFVVSVCKENNLADKAFNARFRRWHECSLCEQKYHGTVRCALGWACWKTNLGRPETDEVRGMAMSVLGNGLAEAEHWLDTLSVQEAELSMKRRLGASEEDTLVVRNNLSNTYDALGRHEDALRMMRDVYSGTLKFKGEEHRDTLISANNYADSLLSLNRFEEAKSVLREVIPVARRVLGENDTLTFRMRKVYAEVLYEDPAATLDDLREAVATLEDARRIGRRVLGGAHPLTSSIEEDVRVARAALRARETPSGSSEEVLQTADDLAAHFG